MDHKLLKRYTSSANDCKLTVFCIDLVYIFTLVCKCSATLWKNIFEHYFSLPTGRPPRNCSILNSAAFFVPTTIRHILSTVSADLRISTCLLCVIFLTILWRIRSTHEDLRSHMRSAIVQLVAMYIYIKCRYNCIGNVEYMYRHKWVMRLKVCGLISWRASHPPGKALAMTLEVIQCISKVKTKIWWNFQTMHI